MSIQDHTIFEHKLANDFYRTLNKVVLKKYILNRSKKIKVNKIVKVLLNVIQRIYDKNPGMQEVIDASMIEVSTEESASPEQVFFILFFLCYCLF